MKIPSSLIPLIIVLITLSVQVNGQQTDHWETVFHSNSEFSYFSSSEGIAPDNWRTPEYDAAAWKTGIGGIGYGDDDDNTIIPSCISLNLRKSFQIIDKSVIAEAVLHMDYDDAFVAYLNGVEIARSSGLSDPYPAYNTASTANHEAAMYLGGVPEEYIISKEILAEHLSEGMSELGIFIQLLLGNYQLQSENLISRTCKTIYKLWNDSLLIFITLSGKQRLVIDPFAPGEIRKVLQGVSFCQRLLRKRSNGTPGSSIIHIKWWGYFSFN